MNNEILTLPDGVPINQGCAPATTWKEISPQEREIAAQQLADLISETHSELFGE